MMGRALGRSAKAAPFWTKAWWERESEEMKMTGREPKWTVRIGPYLVCRFRRTDSNSNKDLRSSMMFPMRGILVGPGGRFSFGKKKS